MHGRWIHALLLGVALLGVGGVIAGEQQLASPVPYSDEAAHVNKVIDLRDGLARAPTPVAAVHTALFSGDSYPNLPSVVALPCLAATRSLAGVRLSLIAWAAAHVAVAVLLGERVWGRAGAWAYAAMVTLAPAVLAFDRLYYVDVPLFATVGMGLVATLASDGFRRAGPTGVLALVAAAGMGTKWVWALFLVVPIGVAAARAVAGTAAETAGAEGEPGGARGSRSVGRRVAMAVGAGAGILALTAGLAGLIASLGTSRYLAQYGATGHLAWVPVAVVAGGAALWAGWMGVAAWMGRREGEPVGHGAPAPRGQRIPAAMNLALLVATVAMLAGPWYTLAQGALWDRYTHEQEMWLARHGIPQWAASLDVARALLPAAEVLVPAGLLLGLITRRGGWTLLSTIPAVILAFRVVVYSLPYDPRYLLPLLPFLAATVVAGWPGLPRWGQVAGIAGIAGLLGVTGYGPPGGGAPLQGLALVPRRVGEVSVPGVARAAPTDGTIAELDALVAEVMRRCHGPACRVRFTGGPDLSLQGRGLIAVTRLAELPLRVEEGPGEDAGAIVVTAGCRGEADRAAAAHNGDGSCWTGSLGTRGCEALVCGEASGAGPAGGLPPNH